MKRQIVAVALCGFAAAMLAQQPKVSNTEVKVEAVSQSLSATVDRLRHASDRLWIGYEVPALAESRLPACSNWSDSSQGDDGCCGEYQLEDDHSFANRHRDEPTAQSVYILLRFEQGELIKVRPVATGCHLNAGGVAFEWLTGVKPEESVSYLAGQAEQHSDHRTLDGLLLAIAYHATPEATHALERIALSSDAAPHTREQAAFWLGVQRGHEGFVALKSLEDKITDSHLREKLAFDFSQNSDPAAEDELIRLAKFDSDTKVREQALFWLAQKAGKRATAALTDAIQNDPETDVKKKAVFALSQLPKDESVPQLIHVADTNSNPVVRKEAFFWLGQSQDPRALAYLEQVLKK